MWQQILGVNETGEADAANDEGGHGEGPEPGPRPGPARPAEPDGPPDPGVHCTNWHGVPPQEEPRQARRIIATRGSAGLQPWQVASATASWDAAMGANCPHAMNAAAYFLSEVNEGGLTTFSGMDYIKKSLAIGYFQY